MTVEACESEAPPPVTDPWNVALEWSYASSGDGVNVMPAVGNLTDDNGDGRVDDDDTPDIVFVTMDFSGADPDTLVALHGDGSGVIFEATGYYGLGGVAIADVTGDGTPDIVAATLARGVAAVDATGALIWATAPIPSMNYYGVPVVADLDTDGDVEIVYDVAVVEGSDGTVLATLGGIVPLFRSPVVADLDQDGSQEILLGGVTFDSAGNDLWQTGGTTWSAFTAIADVDGDPEAEVLTVTQGTNYDGMAYLHESDGTLIRSWAIPGYLYPGPPAAADFDGDGEVEFCIPNYEQLHIYDPDGTEVAKARINDSSGAAGCSGYDFEGDGAYEALFGAQFAFGIYDGATGAALFESVDHGSQTIWEFPVVADVDKDGSAEIIVATNYYASVNGIMVYGHAGSGWPRSGPTWPSHDYNSSNIDPDGHVPRWPDPSWQTTNVFRARPSIDDTAAADLTVVITDVCVADCTYGPVSLGIQVTNQGAMDVQPGETVTIYAEDETPRVVATVTLPAVPAGTTLDGIQVDLTAADVGLNGFRAEVDDDGAVRECDETNNSAVWTESFCP